MSCGSIGSRCGRPIAVVRTAPITPGQKKAGKVGSSRVVRRVRTEYIAKRKAAARGSRAAQLNTPIPGRRMMRTPSSPAATAAQRCQTDPLAQHRAGEGDDEQRADGKDRVAVDEADQRVAPDDQADLGHQKAGADQMGWQPPRPDRGARPFGAAEGEEDDETGEGPVADHDDHQCVVFARKVAGKPVLRRKGGDGGDHQPDAFGGIFGRTHAGAFGSMGAGKGEGGLPLAGRSPTTSARPVVMWRLEPKPDWRVTVNPASASARRTWPAAV